MKKEALNKKHGKKKLTTKASVYEIFDHHAKEKEKNGGAKNYKVQRYVMIDADGDEYPADRIEQLEAIAEKLEERQTRIENGEL